MLIDLFASLSFYLIPYLTGRFFTKRIAQAWILGALIWFIVYFLVTVVSASLKIANFAELIRALAIVVSGLSLINIAVSWFKEKPKISLENIQISGILLIFTAFVYFIIWKRNTPYPLQLNWDIYEHITLANNIVLGKLSFFAPKISDTFTFNSYSPLFGVLLSLPKIIFQKSLIGIYWWLEYWHFLLTAVVSFMLARKVFAGKWLSLTSAIFSSLVFESVIAYSTLFLVPQTLVALIAVFVFLEIKDYKMRMLLIAALVILLMHYVIGVLCLLILALFYLAIRFQPSEKLLKILILISSLVSAFLIALNFFGNWQVLAREEASHYIFPIEQKLGFLLDWYGIILFVFALLGCVKIFKSGSNLQRVILIIALLVFGISLAPFSYFLKFYVVGHYFINIVIIAGVAVLTANLPAVLRLLGIAWLTFVLLVTFYKNQLVYKGPLHFQDYETLVSPQEFAAGDWLANYQKNDHLFLISDPSLQYILEASSGVNTQGGVYMDLQTRKALISINGSFDPEFIKHQLLSIKDLNQSDNQLSHKTLFVIGGRYFAWQNLSNEEKESTFYNIWSPVQMNTYNKIYFDFLNQSQQFKLLYKNDQLAIFEVI